MSLRTILYFLLLTFLLICSKHLKVSAKYYRTIQSGLWRDVSVWESADDVNFSIGKENAVIPPDYLSNTIIIQNNHTVTIDQSAIIDETIVKKGGLLIYGNFPSSILTIENGAGIDLIIEGTFEDSGPVSIVWNSSQSKWILGQEGTIIRTRSTSAILWRDHYDGGMVTIPPTSNWIIRKQSSDNPSISGVNSFYGNLLIENVSPGFWDANTVGSKITGTTSAPVVKGDFVVGTISGNGLNFYSQNNASNLILVKGNMIIHQNSEFQLQDANTNSGGSGIELQGNLLVNGVLSYDQNDAQNYNRILKFSGTDSQLISGYGILFCYNLINEKYSGNLILEKNLIIDNKLFLIAGMVDLNKKTILLQNSSSNSIQRISGWIRSEEFDNSSKIIWNIGNATDEHIFPFGKSDIDYIPFSVSVTSGNIGIVSVSTYATSQTNFPYPTVPTIVLNINKNGIDFSAETVDRFWIIEKSGSNSTASYSFTYANNETTNYPTSLQANSYNPVTNIWENLICCQTTNASIRKVTVSNTSNYFIWSLMEENDPLPLFKNSYAINENIQNYVEELRVFPTHFSDQIFIHAQSEEQDSCIVSIYNSLGVYLNSKHFVLEKGLNIYTIDFSSITGQGMFFLKWQNRNKCSTYRMYRTY